MTARVVRSLPDESGRMAMSPSGAGDESTRIPAQAPTGPLVAEINLAAIAHNCRVLRGLTPGGCKLCVAVKADAYGHGLGLVLPAFEEADVEMLAVAAIAEAEHLRELGWRRGILLLGSELGVYRATQKALRAEWLVAAKVSTTVSRQGDLAALDAAGEKQGRAAAVHFMLDSGMTREGAYADEILSLFEAAGRFGFIEVEGLYTHMASADEADKAFTLEQLRAFQQLVDSLKSRGFALPLLHAANSPAVIDTPQLHFDMIRPGVAVYGCHPSPEMVERSDLRQALRLCSHLSQVKRVSAGSAVGYGCTYRAAEDLDIGIVPVGYADGYDRRLSNRAVMSIGGCIVPVIGRVSMDQVTLDLRPLAASGQTAAPGDEVIVIDDAAAAPNNIEALAQLLDTVPHEVMTGIGGRVQRVAVRRK